MYKAVAMGVVALSLVGVAAIIKHSKNKVENPEKFEDENLVNPCKTCPNEGTDACTCCCEAEEVEFDDTVEDAETEDVVDDEVDDFATKAGKDLEEKIKDFDKFMDDLTEKFSEFSDRLGVKAKDAADKLDAITEYIKHDSEVIKAILRVKPEDDYVDDFDEEDYIYEDDISDEDVYMEDNEEWYEDNDEEYPYDECCEEEYEVPDTDDEFYDESDVVTDEQEYGVDAGTDDFFNPADVDAEDKTYEESDEDAGDFDV